VTSTIKVQRHLDGKYKNYTIAYFVFEKVASCSQYPPNNNVTFYNISVEWDGKRLPPTWSTGMVEDVCGNRGRPQPCSHAAPVSPLPPPPPTPPPTPPPLPLPLL
jgi:hypothetical protein